MKLSSKFDVAVMHDFFIDRLVHSRDVDSFLKSVAATSRRGGGSIHGVPQTEVSGGNAVNLAHALARLGMRTLLITHTDISHQEMLLRGFDGLEADVRVKSMPPGLTVSFEGRTNVMVGDGGGAANFGEEALSDDDWQALRSSRLVCSVNWAANRNGTGLAVALRRNLGEEKMIFSAPADFRDRLSEFKRFLGLVRDKKVADWLSMNGQEASAAAGLLGIQAKGPAAICLQLARSLGVLFDLHTEEGGHSSEGKSVAFSPTAPLKPMRLTGAGDVWDAAAIYGRLAEMGEQERMKFANAAARLYIRSSPASAPTLRQVLGAM